MTGKIVWAKSEDGTLEYTQLTKDQVEEALNILRNSFYKYENVCSAMGLPEHPEAFQDMDNLIREIISDGLSIGCVEKATGKLVAVTINKLESKSSPNLADKYMRLSKTKVGKDVIEAILYVCDQVDVMDHCNVENAMKIRMTGVMPEFRKRGIGKKLHNVALDIARKLNKGDDVRVPVTDLKLGLLKKPQIVVDVCSTFITQKMISDMGMEIAGRVSYKDLVAPNGIHLGDNIPANSNTTHVVYGYLKL